MSRRLRMRALGALLFAGIIAPAFAQTLPSAPVATPSPVSEPPPLRAQPLARRIVLLLPTRSPDFARAAEAVRAGVFAARDALAPDLDLVIADTDDSVDDVQAAYANAAKTAPTAIIGPLTRPAVQAISGMVDVLTPTVALNAIDSDAAPNIVMFALQIESEARQVAQIAFDDQRAHDPSARAKAVVVLGEGLLNKRAAQAFSDAFESRGGTVLTTLNASERGPALQGRLNRLAPSMIFFATDAATASGLRSHMRDIPAYGTSQLNARTDRAMLQDLEGVRLVDMPWLVQRQAPVVQQFARGDESSRFSADLERLYAMGIDALRVALDLAAGTTPIGFDGVTGALIVKGQRVERRAVPAIFRDGEAVVDGL